MKSKPETNKKSVGHPFSEAGMYETLLDEALDIMGEFVDYFEPNSLRQKKWISRVLQFYERIEKMERDYEETRQKEGK